MPKPNDMSRCLAALEQDSTLIAVIEMGKSSWLVAGVVPEIERHRSTIGEKLRRTTP
jgi:transposase